MYNKYMFSKKIIFVTIVFVACIIIVFVFYSHNKTVKISKNDYLNVRKTEIDSIKSVIIGSKTITVDVVNTEIDRERGLSGKQTLAEGTGMLFVFEKPSKWGIWMKNMNFPIDVVWFDNKGVVVSVKEHMTPQSYPEVFTPQFPAWYVLEIPDGAFAKTGVKVGEKAIINVK